MPSEKVEMVIAERMNRAMASEGKTFVLNPRSKFNVKRKIKNVRLTFGGNIELTFFHGKGGTVSRGGNPSMYRALVSQPPGVVRRNLCRLSISIPSIHVTTNLVSIPKLFSFKIV